MLLITFVELRVVAGRSLTRAGRPHAALCCGLEKWLSERHGRGMARARHGMCESNTAALCKLNGKDTI
jgi:hypothetical protein